MQRVTTINTIETSSLCDLSCPYCPCKDQGKFRETGLMDMGTYAKVLRWVDHFTRLGTQLEINLSGVGEPLLHPLIVAMVRAARKSAPRSPIYVVTNGVHVEEKIVQALFDAGLTRMSITDHVAPVTMKALNILKRLKVPYEYSRHAVTHPNNWGGIIDWTDAVDYRFPCTWLDRGQVAILSDGRVTTCCTDAFALGVIGTVDDYVPDLIVKPFSVCPKCHHDIPLRMRNFKEG